MARIPVVISAQEIIKVVYRIVSRYDAIGFEERFSREIDTCFGRILPDTVRLSVESHAVMVVTLFALREIPPIAGFDIFSVYTGIDGGNGPPAFDEILSSPTHRCDVAMEEYGAGAVGVAEGPRSIKRECAVFVHACSAKCIIGALDVAIEKECTFGAYEIARVETAYEADIPAENPIAVTDSELCLHDGATSFFAAQFGT